MNAEELLQGFSEVFGNVQADGVFFAPGRVNLIGEHTDYNGGHVLPCALTMGTCVAARKRKDQTIRLYSCNIGESSYRETSLQADIRDGEHSWTYYPLGMLRAIEVSGRKIPTGLDLYFCGDIPSGSGLSSSASLEIVTGVMAAELFALPGLDGPELARVGQYAENQFCGTKCGIMDQFASVMGRQDQAIYLNTGDLSYDYAPLPARDCQIIAVNSKVKHSLASSAYNDRREECAQALRLLQSRYPLQDLCSCSPEQLEESRKLFPADGLLYRRAKHAVSENLRTKQAFEALRRGDLPAMGQLMWASHESLRSDYEVSCPELDLLVSAAAGLRGVLGSRMTGGGFGGCTVSLVRKAAAEDFIRAIREEYERKTGRHAECYLINGGAGARRLPL